MLFTPRESIEDACIRLVSAGINSANKIFYVIKSEGKTVTIQAVYKALRYLIKDSVLVKTGRTLAVSNEWVTKLTGQLNDSVSLPFLSKGESVSYSYNSLANLDAYWKHLNKALERKYPDLPVFIYNPYGIWLHLDERYTSEITYLREFPRSGRPGFLVIGNDLPLDKSLKKEFQNDFLQIDTWKKSSFPPSEYLTTVGDYIVTTKLSKELTQKITHLYHSNYTPRQELIELKELLRESTKSKLKLECNPDKALRLQKKLFKNFFMPLEQKKRYGLAPHTT